MVICLKGGADLHIAQLMPLPNGQTAVCVCVCVLYIQTHRQTSEVVNIWQSYKQERDCLVHLLRLLAVCWPGAQST